MKPLTLSTQSYAAEDIPALGNRHLAANGYLGVRGTLEEHRSKELVAINLAGIYDRFGDGWREPLNAPNPFWLTLWENDAPLSLPAAAVRTHTQALDARYGLQSRQTCFESGTTLTVERFAHMADVHVLALCATVTAGRDATYGLDTGIDGEVWDIHGPHYREMCLATDGAALTALCTTNENDTVAVCALPSLALPHTREDVTEGRARVARFRFALKAGQTARLTLTAAVFTGKDVPDPLRQALSTVCAASPYEALRETHLACWRALWQRADIRMDGDEAAETALNYSAYHLLSIAPRHAGSLSVPARGLSGQTYKGAIFWDTEMFMLDFYLATLPETAKTLMRYRIDTLNGARAKARQYGLRGAFYAWESQEGGFDACSDYNVTDVFTGRPMRTYFRDKQIHITAAVVYGLCKTADWTGDPSLWLTGGTEVLIEAARFYHSLLVRRVESDRCELWDVIGPDEYHERVNNNAYTNEMARFVWRRALAVTAWLQSEHPQTYSELESRLGFARELPAFALAAETLVCKAPRADGVIEQFDGYFALEDAPLEAVRARLKDPREYWGGAYGVASQTQLIKQADVITLLYMLKDRYTRETLAANYDYYLPRTEHGSSLSACMYALAACAVGRPNEAYPLLMKSAQADLSEGGKQWAGLVYIGGTHPAAAGGAYMALLWGFMGLTVANGALSLAPQLPEGWRGVACHVQWRGQTVRLGCGTLANEA